MARVYLNNRNYQVSRVYRTGYLLDQVSGALAAYSLRRVKFSYSGSAIQVRRSSDNTTLDIGFNIQGLLDTSALLSFVGGGSGFVTVFYDQSGFGRNLTQATVASQPRVVNAGVLDVNTFGKPSIFFDGVNDNLFRTDAFMWVNLQTTVSACIQPTQMTDSRFICEGSSASVNPVYCPFQSSSVPGSNMRTASLIRDDSNVVQFSSNTIVGTSDTFNGMSHVISAVDNGSNLKHYVDGTLSINNNYTRSTNTMNRFAIGALVRSSAASFFGGLCGETIVFNRALGDSDRAVIEADQAAYFKS